MKGEVRLRSYTQDPEAIAGYALTNEAGRSLEIERLRRGPKGLIAHLKGVTTREAAEALTGSRLYVPRALLPETDDDEWYYADLVGLEAVDRDGNRIGTVAALHNFGAGDLIEIEPAAGGEAMLLPFNEQLVVDVDLATRRITLVVPEIVE